MAGRIDGKVAVITGGGNGIGRAMALRFLAEGGRVVIADLNPRSAEETLSLAREAGHGDHIRFVRADVTREADVAAAIQAAPDAFGRLDCVFNNAGVAGAFGPITHLDGRRLGLHLRRARARRLPRHEARRADHEGAGAGRLRSSTRRRSPGSRGGDGPQAYSAAKAAVINLTRAVAVELAPDRIRVNAICPGGILTPLLHRGNPEAMEPIARRRSSRGRRHGRPEHIAGAALFLASDDARFVTGEALVVDGGLTAAGSSAAEKLGMGGAMYAASGMDRGSSGQEPTLRTLE